MAKKKRAAKKTKRTPSPDPTCTFCRYVAAILQGSRDLNQGEKQNLVNMAKQLKD